MDKIEIGDPDMTNSPNEFDPNAQATPATPPIPPPLPDFTPHALAQRQAAGLETANTESMPVLEAFQQFLDAERRRSRNRMILLSAAFAGVLIIVIAAGVVAALSYVRPVQAGLATLQRDIGGSERRATRAARKVDEAMEQLSQRDRRLREDIGRDKQSLTEAQVTIKQQTESLQTDMDRSKDILRQLQQDNLRLRSELKAATVPAPSLAAAPTVPAPSSPQEAVAAERPVPVAPGRFTAGPQRGSRSFELSIAPVGADEGVAWRISVPE
jgi:hypothetical protein